MPKTRNRNPVKSLSGPRPKADSLDAAKAELRREDAIGNSRLREIAAALQQNDASSADADLQAYLQRHPDDADALRLLAQIQIRDGRFEDAALTLSRCLEQAPDLAAARFEYASVLLRLDRFEAVLEELGRLLEADGANPLFRQMKANVLRIVGEEQASLAIYEELTNEMPHRSELWIGYGHGLRTAGLRSRSEAAYREAIARRPSNGLAYWSLANLKTFRFGDADVAAMQRELGRPGLSPGDRIPLQFALAKALEDQGAFGKAFECYARANAAMRMRLATDPEILRARVGATREVFTPHFLRSRSGAGCLSPAPIFIVGRPRSGSTLIEQILASHSAIEGTAELPYIGNLAKRLSRDADYPAALRQLDPAALKAFGEEYLDRARVHRKLQRPFFIDKNPVNFWHAGLIHLILPNAKIVDARRNPAACLLSMFKLYFDRPRPSLVELGHSYRDYVQLMAHFDSVLPGRIHRVVYERLVANPEVEIRRLLDYLGLPFEERCLRFHETRRTVLTSSSEQVRRPISGEAVDRWRAFEPWLGPLLVALGPAFECYPDAPEEGLSS